MACVTPYCNCQLTCLSLPACWEQPNVDLGYIFLPNLYPSQHQMDRDIKQYLWDEGREKERREKGKETEMKENDWKEKV